MLQIYLFLLGIVMSAAILFAFLPKRVMKQIGEFARLPPFEVTPIFEYMARSLCILCTLIGIACLYLALHTTACIDLIRFIGLCCCPLVVLAVVLHRKIGTPLWWMIGDAIGTLAFGPGLLLVSHYG